MIKQSKSQIFVNPERTISGLGNFVLENDQIINCNTVDGPVEITLLETNSGFDKEYKLYIIDESDNASVNNITITAPADHLINGEQFIIIDKNKGNLLIRISKHETYSAYFSYTDDEGCEVIDITYLELYDLVVNGLLDICVKYRLTDYRSVNFLNGVLIANNNPSATDPNFNPLDVYTGDIEVLILKATSPYEISEIGFSETFVGDVVLYEPYTNKIGLDFDIYVRQILPDNTTVLEDDWKLLWDGNNVYFNMPANYPALFGHYFYIFCIFDDGVNQYYQDGCFEPLTPNIAICQYPYTSNDVDYGYPKSMSRIKVENNGTKIVLLDLTQADFNNYVSQSLYVNTVYAHEDAYGWISRRNDTHRQINVPFDFRGRKYRRFEVDLTPINSDLGMDYYGIGDEIYGQTTTGNFKDLPVFFDNIDIFNIQWEGRGGPNVFWYCGYSDNNVFGYNCNDNSFKDITYDNTVLRNFQWNNLGDYFYKNIIGSNFSYNNIGNFVYLNVIANLFLDNKIGSNFNTNRIGSIFENNIIGNYCFTNQIGSNFIGNNIKDYFYINNIGSVFTKNVINDSFFTNIILNNFQYNEIKYQITGTNFTFATHVYGDYNCTIFKNSAGNLRLSYIDGTNTVQYATINS